MAAFETVGSGTFVGLIGAFLNFDGLIGGVTTCGAVGLVTFERVVGVLLGDEEG